MTDKVHPVASAPPVPGAYYKAKGQPLPPPATYRERKRGRGPCCCCLLSLCSILTLLVVLLGIAVLVFWLVVQPRVPKYDVQDVRISGLTSTSSSSTLSPKVSFQIEARNPNKHLGIYYDDIHFKVETEGITVGEKDLSGFYQGHKNTTIVPVDMEYDVPAQDASQLLSEDQSNFPLYVRADVKVRVKVGSVKSHKFKVKVRCNLNVDLTAAGDTAQIKYKHCKVDADNFW